MPGETEKTNTERVQELYDSFAKGDFEAIRDITDPDMELHEPKGIAGGGTHHGFSEIGKNVFSKTGNEREDVSVVPERYVEEGDTVVVLLTVSEDDLDTETDRSTNTYSYRLRDLKTGDTLPMAVRHQDFVVPKIGSSSLSRSIR